MGIRLRLAVQLPAAVASRKWALEFLSNNVYTGITNINQGTLQAGAVNIFSATPASIVNVGSIFDLNSNATAVATLQGSGLVTLGSATLTLSGNNTSVYSGVISNTGSLVKQGTGTFTLTGANTYTGGTTVSVGTLALSGTGTLASNGAVIANATFDVSAATVAESIGNFSGSGALVMGNESLTVNQSLSQTFSGSISGNGSATFTKAGAATLQFAGIGNYSSATLVAAGSLQAGSTTSLSPNSAFTVNATLDLNSFSNTIGSLAGSGTVTLGSGTLTTGNGNSTAFSGSVTGSGGLTKVGTGSLLFPEMGTFTPALQTSIKERCKRVLLIFSQRARPRL